MSSASLIALLALAALGLAYFAFRRYQETQRRADLIRYYQFPRGLYESMRKHRPTLDAKQFQLVARALRHFFLAHLKSGREFVSMPSQIVDELWHEFILDTRAYQRFCDAAFGQMLHHSPAVVMKKQGGRMNAGLRRVWWYCCREENINPRKPTRLPLLFALDRKLGIENGFVYELDCQQSLRRQDDGTTAIHCGTDFGDASFDGSLNGYPGESSSSDGGWFGDAIGDSSCGGGCGGGCGGD